MVVVPVPAEVAIPAELMMATPGLDDVQLTKLVKVCVVPSLKWPVAVNPWLVPRRMEGLPGVTVIEVRLALVTTRVLVPTMPLE